MGPKGKPVKADALNANLKAVDVYSGIQAKQIIAWLGLRNAAAHGEWDDVSGEDVDSMIEGVSRFVDQHPA